VVTAVSGRIRMVLLSRRRGSERGAGEGFGTGGRVVVRKVSGVRLAANARDAVEGPATAFSS